MLHNHTSRNEPFSIGRAFVDQVNPFLAGALVGIVFDFAVVQLMMSISGVDKNTMKQLTREFVTIIAQIMPVVCQESLQTTTLQTWVSMTDGSFTHNAVGIPRTQKIPNQLSSSISGLGKI